MKQLNAISIRSFLYGIVCLFIITVSYSCTEASSKPLACVDYPEGCPDEMMCHDGFCMTSSDVSDIHCLEVDCGENRICYMGRCYDIYIEPETDPCAGIDCEEGMECYQGYCYEIPVEDDPCEGIECGEHQVCFVGTCFDACPEHPSCYVDPCVGVVCSESQICYSGTCVDVVTPEQDPCVGVVCRDGEICVQGSCFDPVDPDDGVKNLCEGVVCHENEVCYEGSCVGQDHCVGIGCPKGYFCYQGNCILGPQPGQSSPNPDPSACYPLTCPMGRICVDGSCVPHNEPWLDAVNLKFNRFLMEGSVLDALGRPVSGVKIFVQNKLIPIRTNTEGKFAIPIIAHQDVKLSLAGHQDIQLKAHPDIRNLELQFKVNNITP